MRYTVRVLARPSRQLKTIAQWWRANRPEAPTLAEDEVLALIASLDEHPERGHLAEDGAMRVLVARQTKLLIVYRVRTRAKRVDVFAIRRP
ncbi:MAG: hypothetical protein JWP01_766 [Myxococcales bacterium]|nr:hypothetical protein [Myxococcales bacterium]